MWLFQTNQAGSQAAAVDANPSRFIVYKAETGFTPDNIDKLYVFSIAPGSDLDRKLINIESRQNEEYSKIKDSYEKHVDLRLAEMKRKRLSGVYDKVRKIYEKKFLKMMKDEEMAEKSLPRAVRVKNENARASEYLANKDAVIYSSQEYALELSKLEAEFASKKRQKMNDFGIILDSYCRALAGFTSEKILIANGAAGTGSSLSLNEISKDLVDKLAQEGITGNSLLFTQRDSGKRLHSMRLNYESLQDEKTSLLLSALDDTGGEHILITENGIANRNSAGNYEFSVRPTGPTAGADARDRFKTVLKAWSKDGSIFGVPGNALYKALMDYIESIQQLSPQNQRKNAPSEQNTH
jgi:hypothetical protein